MRLAIIIITAGLITIIFGVIFHLQGQSLVGPESSFMYSNQDWIEYGFYIVIAGMILSGTGFILRRITHV